MRRRPNSIPRRLQALVLDGPVYKTAVQLSCCQPPIATSINHFSSMFNFTGSLCFLKCVKLPWADFRAVPFSAWEPQWARSSHDSVVQFLPQAGKGGGLARSRLFSRLPSAMALPVPPLPDEWGGHMHPLCPPPLS